MRFFSSGGLRSVRSFHGRWKKSVSFSLNRTDGRTDRKRGTKAKDNNDKCRLFQPKKERQQSSSSSSDIFISFSLPLPLCFTKSKGPNLRSTFSSLILKSIIGIIGCTSFILSLQTLGHSLHPSIMKTESTSVSLPIHRRFFSLCLTFLQRRSPRGALPLARPRPPSK